MNKFIFLFFALATSKYLLYLCTMKQVVDYIVSRLEGVYGECEARELAYWILEESTRMTRFELLGCKDTKNIPNMEIILQRLLKKEPIQYIFEHCMWKGLDLKVTPATLIPRTETAEMVWLITKNQPTVGRQSTDSRPTVTPSVLDIGTGSGCIAIALKKKYPSWDVWGMDISEEALTIARENALRNNVDVHWLKGDIFTDEIGHFDLIVSNPPYVRESEKETMDTNVLDYEPATALFVPDNDPLCYYRRIARMHAAPELFFEINEALGAEMVTLLEQEGYTDIVLTQDSYDKDRFIRARMAE